MAKPNSKTRGTQSPMGKPVDVLSRPRSLHPVAANPTELEPGPALVTFVLGMHRSGTSAFAGLLRTGGLFAGKESDLLPADAANPLGYHERRSTMEACDQALTILGGSWLDPPSLDLESASEARAVLVKSIRDLRREESPSRRRVMKDPRLTLLSRWISEVRHADDTFVLCFRNPVTVARSLADQHGLSLFGALALWETYYISFLTEPIAEEATYFDYDLALRETSHVEAALSRVLSVSSEFDIDSVSEVVEESWIPSLQTEGVKAEDAANYLSYSQMAIWTELRKRASGRKPGRQLVRRVSDSSVSILRSERQLRVLREDLHGVQVLNQSLELQLRQAQASVPLLLDERDSLVEKVSEMETRVEAASADRDSLAAQLAAVDLERVEMVALLEERASDLSLVAIERAEFAEQLESERRLRATLEIERDDRKEEFAAMRARLEAAAVERDAVAEQLATVDSERVEVLGRLERLSVELRSVEIEHRGLVDELERERLFREGLSVERDAVVEQFAASEAEQLALLAQLETLSGEHSRLLAGFEAEHESLRSQLAEAKRLLDEADDLNNALRTSLANRETERDSIVERLAVADFERSELRGWLDVRTAELELVRAHVASGAEQLAVERALRRSVALERDALKGQISSLSALAESRLKALEASHQAQGELEILLELASRESDILRTDVQFFESWVEDLSLERDLAYLSASERQEDAQRLGEYFAEAVAEVARYEATTSRLQQEHQVLSEQVHSLQNEISQATETQSALARRLSVAILDRTFAASERDELRVKFDTTVGESLTLQSRLAETARLLDESEDNVRSLELRVRASEAERRSEVTAKTVVQVELEAVSGERNQLAAALSQLSTERAVAAAERIELAHALELAESQLAKSFHLEARVAELDDVVGTLRVEVERKQAQLEAISRSESWRLGRFLTWLPRFILRRRTELG